MELVDSLQTAFSMRSKELLGDVADTLVPAVKRVKDAHQRLNERVDHDYGAGILDFNETCVKMERLSISEYDEVQRAFQTSKVTQSNLDHAVSFLIIRFSNESELSGLI